MNVDFMSFVVADEVKTTLNTFYFRFLFIIHSLAIFLIPLHSTIYTANNIYSRLFDILREDNLHK